MSATNPCSPKYNVRARSSSSLRRSSKKAKRDTKKPLRTCPYCVDVVAPFTSDRHLDEHLRSEHADRVFECEMCSRVHDRSLLIDHMKGHAEETGIDGSEGGDVNESHRLLVGVDNFKENDISDGRGLGDVRRPFLCTLCNHTFGYNCALKQHIKSKHSVVRGYQCFICDKAFKTSSGLYNHRRLVHNPEYNFPCKNCDQKFKLQHELQRHVRTVHERDIRYFCDQCPKGFYVQDSLTKHKRTHVRDVEFGCHKCLFKTTQKRYLVCHSNRKHGEGIGARGGKKRAGKGM